MSPECFQTKQETSVNYEYEAFHAWACVQKRTVFGMHGFQLAIAEIECRHK